MLNFSSGVSGSVNSVKATRECLEQALKNSSKDTNQLIFHSTSGHNFKQILSTAHEICPNASIVGCTGSGVIGPRWVSEAMRALSVMAISGNEVAVSSIQNISSTNSKKKSLNCATDLLSKLPDTNMVLAFGPGLNVNGEEIVDGIEAVLGGNIPILGALAGFNGNVPRTHLFHEQNIFDDALVLIGFADKSLSVIKGAHHGSVPQEEFRFTVTKSEGTRVDEFDGKPAWPTLMESMGMPATKQPGEVIPLLGLGIDLTEEEKKEYDNPQILHAPLQLSDDGNSVYLQVVVPEGTSLISCQRDEDHIFNGVKRLTEKLTKEIGNQNPVAVFQADCMARGRMSHNIVTKDEITKNIQSSLLGDKKVAWLGVYGFGEFCMLNKRNRFHNYTTALSILVRDS
jgi:hypothetical protein